MKIDVNVNGTEPLVQALNELAAALSKTGLPEAPKVKAPNKKKSDAPEAITLEEVRAKLAALSQSGKQAEVKALIQKYGASKLSEVPKEKYPELLKEAEEI